MSTGARPSGITAPSAARKAPNGTTVTVVSAGIIARIGAPMK